LTFSGLHDFAPQKIEIFRSFFINGCCESKKNIFVRGLDVGTHTDRMLHDRCKGDRKVQIGRQIKEEAEGNTGT
jgi:hypothetical protein